MRWYTDISAYLCRLLRHTDGRHGLLFVLLYPALYGGQLVFFYSLRILLSTSFSLFLCLAEWLSELQQLIQH